MVCNPLEQLRKHSGWGLPKKIRQPVRDSLREKKKTPSFPQTDGFSKREKNLRLLEAELPSTSLTLDQLELWQLPWLKTCLELLDKGSFCHLQLSMVAELEHLHAVVHLRASSF